MPLVAALLLMNDASNRPTLSVVVPARDEADTLPTVIPAVVKAAGDVSHEIVVVDDGSVDATWTVLEGLKRTYPQIVAVRLTRSFGHQAAILAGLVTARGDAVLSMDADGQHPPESIPQFLEQWQLGSQVVQGIRLETEGEGVLKRWTSRLFYRVFSALGGPPIDAGSADFRLLSRAAVDTLIASVGPLLFLRGLIPWLGYPTSTVPFKARARVGGRPSYTWFRMIQLSLHGLLSFTTIPLRVATILGFIVAAFSFLYLALVLVAWVYNDALPGWASIMGLLSLLGGIQLLSVGILGEYLGRVFLASVGRPHFVIRDRL
jgi:glycosyltransferase involved in cell wall biosynthesis